MAQAMPWDKNAPYCDELFFSNEGRVPINARATIWVIIFKHEEDLKDRAKVYAYLLKHVHVAFSGVQHL
jgi:hypothetical protein